MWVDNAHALPRQGRTGNVVPVSQFGEFARLGRGDAANGVRLFIIFVVAG